MAEGKPPRGGDGWSRMSGDAHVRFWESAGVKLPRATQLAVCQSSFRKLRNRTHRFQKRGAWSPGAPGWGCEQNYKTNPPSR